MTDVPNKIVEPTGAPLPSETRAPRSVIGANLPADVPEQFVQHMKTFLPYALKRLGDIHEKQTRFVVRAPPKQPQDPDSNSEKHVPMKTGGTNFHRQIQTDPLPARLRG
jgi:hypothetical protein